MKSHLKALDVDELITTYDHFIIGIVRDLGIYYVDRGVFAEVPRWVYALYASWLHSVNTIDHISQITSFREVIRYLDKSDKHKKAIMMFFAISEREALYSRDSFDRIVKMLGA